MGGYTKEFSVDIHASYILNTVRLLLIARTGENCYFLS